MIIRQRQYEYILPSLTRFTAKQCATLLIEMGCAQLLSYNASLKFGRFFEGKYFNSSYTRGKKSDKNP